MTQRALSTVERLAVYRHPSAGLKELVTPIELNLKISFLQDAGTGAGAGTGGFAASLAEASASPPPFPDASAGGDASAVVVVDEQGRQLGTSSHTVSITPTATIKSLQVGGKAALHLFSPHLKAPSASPTPSLSPGAYT